FRVVTCGRPCRRAGSQAVKRLDHPPARSARPLWRCCRSGDADGMPAGGLVPGRHVLDAYRAFFAWPRPRDYWFETQLFGSTCVSIALGIGSHGKLVATRSRWFSLHNLGDTRDHDDAPTTPDNGPLNAGWYSIVQGTDA